MRFTTMLDLLLHETSFGNGQLAREEIQWRLDGPESVVQADLRVQDEAAVPRRRLIVVGYAKVKCSWGIRMILETRREMRTVVSSPLGGSVRSLPHSNRSR